jgi:hypothetical protein
LTANENAPRDGPHEAQSRFDECGFPGPVRADDRHEHARRHREIHVPQNRLVAVRDREVVNFDGGGRLSHVLTGAKPTTNNQ